MHYLLIKYIHILSATILFGTGLGSAFYLWRANQSNDIAAMRFAAKNVVIADWIFTTPAVIIQPLSGFYLMSLLHYSLTSTWIVVSLALYVVTGACWLPVVWLQIKMHAMLQAPDVDYATLPQRYHLYKKIWFILGWPAFIAVLAIFYFMIVKPM